MRRARTCPAGATTAIFLEGGDEERMLRRFINTDGIFVQVFNGRVPGLLRNVAEATTKDPGWPGIRSVGMILDVEGEDGDETQAAVTRSWKLVQLAFKSLGWPGPGSPATVLNTGERRAGGFLLPDANAKGASETLLLRTARTTELACIESFFDCTPNPGRNPAQRDKCRAQALAATASFEGRVDHLWGGADLEHPALQPLRQFLRDLTA